jgi:hypothetical protein
MKHVATQSQDGEAGARPYLELVALVAIGWMWLRMTAADNEPSHGKRAIALFVGCCVSALVPGRQH